MDGTPFSFVRVDAVDRATHELDRHDVTREMLEWIGDDGARHEYRIDQIIEEAISSSLIEGAKLSTRAIAKAMIRDNREPTDKGERMVMNNYEAMLRVTELAKRDLGRDDLLELHTVLCRDALDTADVAGRFRTETENVRVEDVTGEVWFYPPPAHEIEERIERMLEFANGSNAESQFTHPLIRAIVMHFWLAYLHPFVDGNGRMARALFYWQMLRSGYDFAQYLSISGPIHKSRRQYYLSFVYTETDDGDLTYFLLNQLQVLRRATEELRSHLRERADRLRQLSAAVSDAKKFNHRQQAALVYSVRNSHVGLTVSGHATSHQVTYLTARKDLQELVSSGHLEKVRVGRTDRYFPTASLAGRLSVPPR